MEEREMILAYIDESGKNYKKDKHNYFTADGPYGLWSCILVDEKKYFDVERTLQDLSKKYLKIDPRKKELHATDIWESRKISQEKEKEVRYYFEELIQFISKMRIQVIFGVQQKNPSLKRDNRTIEKELAKAQYSLLTLLEYELAKMREPAVLVADLDPSSREGLKNLVFQRTKWRFQPPSRKIKSVKPKFLFEFQSHYIVDQLHHVQSQDSLLMQFSDNICFVLRKVLEHLYLLNFPKYDGSRPMADKNEVPITDSTFNSFVNFCEVKFAYFDEKVKDVSMGDLFNLSRENYQFERPTSGVYLLSRQQSDSSIVLRQFTPYS